MIFIDTPVFIRWIAVDKDSVSLEDAISGYILNKINKGMKTASSTLVKDEIMIWLSRYRGSKIESFIRALKALINLEILTPNFQDEENAVREFGKYPLGISDLININMMKRLNINLIATQDKGFDRYPGIRRLFYEFKEEPEFKEFAVRLHENRFKLKFEI